MKNYLILIAVFIGAISFGQSKEVDTVIYNGNQKTIKYTDGSQSISVSNKNVIQSVAKKKPKFESKQAEVEYLNNYIKSIETKISHIKNDPEQDKLAQEKGWYDQMNVYISQSKARIEEIHQILRSKNK